MKNLIDAILEVHKDKYGQDILIDDEITLEEIQNAIFSSSFMKDRATIYVSDKEDEPNGSYDKIAKNKWHYSPNQEHAIGGNYSDKEMFDIINKYKYKKMYLK